ncbi:hypothetical protein [Alkalicoccobacillus porphyridii]|uniref:Uncharacterized protein n=1 Tax=Alkalicoccobacillus porphyridii TaxID=2597270 RepID=A0A553ZTM3_9BACI|nr:hypothetical protein [Alkalicoccobacillus porphyridii]TSB44820.1 hypothetical protein FN960_19645 [Alkalicoccobacillus porphyridii]
MKIKLSLLDNAYDFLNSSLHDYHLATNEEYPDDYKRFWKSAIVDLVQSMELMFKEVLRRDHKVLLYERIDNPKKTVSITNALQRLKNILNLDFTDKDEKTIKRAIGIRNDIIHFEVELNTPELLNIYIIIFEFLHSFHFRYLDGELHNFILPNYWEAEALLIEQFKKTDQVLYGGVNLSKYYPIEIAEAQLFSTFTISGIEYERIKHGEELDRQAFYISIHCGDCAVKEGYYHVLGCDLEVCPKCAGQAISCSCDIYDEGDNH